MQTVATISKSTKQGVSVFYFVQTPCGEFWMFGGVSPKAIQFKSMKELNAAVMTWVNKYGYSFGDTPVVKSLATTTQVKQKSQLPADLQADLWALQPTAA